MCCICMRLYMHLGKFGSMLMSPTTRFDSTFHPFTEPSHVPRRSWHVARAIQERKIVSAKNKWTTFTACYFLLLEWPQMSRWCIVSYNKRPMKPKGEAEGNGERAVLISKTKKKRKKTTTMWVHEVDFTDQSVRFHLPIQGHYLCSTIDGGIARGGEGWVGGQNPKKRIMRIIGGGLRWKGMKLKVYVVTCTHCHSIIKVVLHGIGLLRHNL